MKYFYVTYSHPTILSEVLNQMTWAYEAFIIYFLAIIAKLMLLWS